MARYRRKADEIEAITFEELVAHGIAQGVPLTNGMPWSFEYQGHPITHENDNCYLVMTAEGQMRFEREDMLVTDGAGRTRTAAAAYVTMLYDRIPEGT